MVNENPEAIYCEDNGEHRVYCDICDNLFIERLYKNHFISQTPTSSILKKKFYEKI